MKFKNINSIIIYIFQIAIKKLNKIIPISHLMITVHSVEISLKRILHNSKMRKILISKKPIINLWNFNKNLNNG